MYEHRAAAGPTCPADPVGPAAPADPAGRLMWSPGPEALDTSAMGRFLRLAQDRHSLTFDGYDALWNWSVTRPAEFWDTVREFFDVRLGGDPSVVLAEPSMPGTRWYPDTTVNVAEHVFRASSPDRPALVEVREEGAARSWSWKRLREATAALAATLRAYGVGPGDRVVGYLPNGAEAVVGFLATASIGAVWALCNHDLAAPAVADRFAPLEPAVLIAADGSRFGGRDHDRRAAVETLTGALPCLRATILVPRLGLPPATPAPDPDRVPVVDWAEATAAAPSSAELDFTAVPFDHPLWVLFSSGTTGPPKGIVHGHGGVLLEQYKMLGLHLDLGPGDRFHWYTSTSWMMWNTQVSGLLLGVTAVLYDGSPNTPDPDRLWRIAAEQRLTFLGTGAGQLQNCARAGLRPRDDHDLSALRAIGSTGSPLPADTYVWALDAVGAHIPVHSSSGGTDVVTSFAGGSPLLPVWAGEISGRCLGVAAEARDAAGRAVVDEPGELVVTVPMPSMPVGFWNDPDGSRYHAAYFADIPGVWRHGDRVTVTSRGSLIMHGRSDATLNRDGVRLGSAEIYRAVETVPGIRDAVVVGVELPGGGYWLPLFVHLDDGVRLDDGLRARLVTAIRTLASPRHVPDEILVVPGVPHTVTGKRLEVPLKKILLGTPPAQVLTPGAVDRPALLDHYAHLGRTRLASPPAPHVRSPR